MQSENLRDKLIRVERTINIYSKDGNESLQEINIDNIPFDTLKVIVSPKEGDNTLRWLCTRCHTIK